MTERRKSRERIGADTARVWARELRLGNPHAKAILLALANYMNEDGSAFPGLATISRDTDISEETVIKRLRWLQEIGAVIVFKCWIDENGRRNHDGRGRITSSEIRFLLDADIDEIEQAAAASSEPRPLRGAAKQSADAASTDSKSSTRPHGEQNSGQHSVSPRLAPYWYPTPAGYQPEESPTVLTEELEDSPQPPSGGNDANDDFGDFEKDWREPILRQSLTRQVWAALTPEERQLARKAARGYVAWRKAQKKPPNTLNAHTFLREKDAWSRFAPHAPDVSSRSEAPRERVHMSPATLEGRAFAVCQAIAGTEGAWSLLRDQIPNGEEALATLWRVDDRGRIDTSDWVAVKSGTPQCVAWAERVKEWLKSYPRERRFWLDAQGNIVRAREEAHQPEGALLPSHVQGLLVPPTPTGFPPAKGNHDDQLARGEFLQTGKTEC